MHACVGELAASSLPSVSLGQRCQSGAGARKLVATLAKLGASPAGRMRVLFIGGGTDGGALAVAGSMR
jgi:hypothetical protein